MKFALTLGNYEGSFLKGLVNRMLAPQKLKEACDKAVNDPELLARDGVTFCNIALQGICFEMGYDKLAGLLANQIYAFVKKDKRWDSVNMWEANCHAIVGGIAIAAQQGKPSGHVAVYYPRPTKVVSSKWKTTVPLVANVGKRNAVTGLNMAFAKIPESFILKDKA